jgi:hypothetical protein
MQPSTIALVLAASVAVGVAALGREIETLRETLRDKPTWLALLPDLDAIPW